MRYLLFFAAALSALLVTVFHADARTNIHHSRHSSSVANPVHISSRVFQIAKSQQASLMASHKIAARGTDYPSERLVATSFYSLNYADTPMIPIGIEDSAHFVYSGQRGSTYNPDNLGFITPSAGNFAAGTSFSDYFQGTTGQFNSNIDISNVLADIGLIWNSNTTNLAGNDSFAFAETVRSVYDAANNVTSCSDSNDNTSSFQWDKVINRYGPDSLITSSLDLQWSGTAWDSNTYTAFYYNSAKQLIEDSTATYSGSWGPTGKDYYNYYSTGYVSYANQWNYTTAWMDGSKVFLYYNSDNTLKRDSASQNGGSGWVPVFTDSFGYTPGANYWTSLNTHIAVTGFWLSILQTKHLNSSFLTDTFMAMQYGSPSSYTNHFLGGTMATYSYDAYNNPVISYQRNYTVTNMTTGAGAIDTTVDNIFHFYYENYTAAAVSKVVAPEVFVNIFPNPATNSINITIKGINRGAQTMLTLQNMLGQTVLSESLPWMTDTEALPVSGIAPGTYILLVQDGAGNSLSSQKIVKQ